MVHIEHTSVTAGAVMASFGLEDIAHQTVPPSLVFRVTQVEAPEDRYLARVCGHRLYEGPQHHDENHMEDRQKQNDSSIVYNKHGVRHHLIMKIPIIKNLPSTLGSHTRNV